MRKPKSCSQVVAAAINTFGLHAVREAVEMAVALTSEPKPQRKSPKKAGALKPEAVTSGVAQS